MESFKDLGSILTNDGRYACEIKCRIAMAKTAFNKMRALFCWHGGLAIGEEDSEVLQLERSFVWC